MKSENGQAVMSKGIKIFLIVAMVLMIVAIAVFTTFFGIYYSREKKWIASLENSYQYNYHMLKDNILNMETNLSKIRVVRSDALQQELLVETAMRAGDGASLLSRLAIDGYDFSSLIKYTNQVSDFCLYCDKKLSFGGQLTSEDYKTLDEMYSMSLDLGKKLSEVRSTMTSKGEKFVSGLGKISQSFGTIMADYSNGIVKYPSLIYDGPFSDSLVDKVPKALSGANMDINNVRGHAVIAITDYEIKEINYEYACESNFRSHIYNFVTNDDLKGTIQLSEQGGKAVMWDIETEVSEPKFNKAEGEELARQYCVKLGLDNMQPVWGCVTNSVLYVNLCYTQDGVIIYPDMVKVKVSLQTGKIVGYEGLNYIYNHTARTIEKNTITDDEIMAMDFGGLKVTSIKNVIIPTQGGREMQAVEVFGMLQDCQFFVYVDCKTKMQVKVMEVIDSDEGELLM